LARKRGNRKQKTGRRVRGRKRRIRTETDRADEKKEIDHGNVDAASEEVVGMDNFYGGDDVELAELLDEREGGGDHGCKEG
jgi:hypothetical protein